MFGLDQYPVLMQAHLRNRILELTGADAIVGSELVQPLWNNYGTLSRIHLQGSSHPSVMVKHIQIPNNVSHPRGFATSISKSRKVRSYQTESHWYQHQNSALPAFHMFILIGEALTMINCSLVFHIVLACSITKTLVIPIHHDRHHCTHHSHLCHRQHPDDIHACFGIVDRLSFVNKPAELGWHQNTELERASPAP